MHEWLTSACKSALGINISRSQPIFGGDINKAFLLESKKQKIFVKFNSSPYAESMLAAEQRGLNLIKVSNTIGCPNSLGLYSDSSGSALFLEFIESGYKSNAFWESFGSALASFHQTSQESFGLDHHNFLGSLPQENNPEASWISFFTKHRIKAQVELALKAGWLQKGDLDLFESLYEKIPNILPEETPSLLHGDLWSGNFLCSASQAPILIDPAVYFGHREMDLAMSRLFGGFDRAFYQSYESAWPLLSGFEERIELYQLYYLLAHLNLFGKGYYTSLMRIVQSYL